MNRPSTYGRAVAVIALSALFLPALSTAQAPPSLLGDPPVAADNYGTRIGLAWIPATRFNLPVSSAAPRLSHELSNFFHAAGAVTPQRYFGSLDGVPIGAAMNRLTCIYRDTSATNDFRADFYQATQDFSGMGEGSRTNDLLHTMTSTGTPGVNFGGVNIDPPVINRIAPTNLQATQNYLIAEVADDTSFAGCFIVYSLTTSPAPATATFGDVPTTHQFFQFIEAMAASGITTGCAPGQYCPDQLVTRAQMAAFFARALGLFYPQ